MTEYEKLSLTLLACIAKGVALQVTQPGLSPELRAEHGNMLITWAKSLEETLAEVGEGVRRSGATGSEPPKD